MKLLDRLIDRVVDRALDRVAARRGLTIAFGEFHYANERAGRSASELAAEMGRLS